jgi:uncharacterized protein (DUF362 family)
MNRSTVAVVRYEKPYESVKKAVALCDGLSRLPSRARVFIKPNIVFWTRTVTFPKWGVITTSRVIEDMVKLLKEHGVAHITIGEGVVMRNQKDAETPAHAFETLGYSALKKRYNISVVNVFERPFREVDMGEDITLKFNEDILDSDFIVDIPAMKTHNQTVVSLGIKNLKGVIDMKSRKRCHNADPVKDLHFHVARLADKLPSIFTLIDGIYTLERGPGFDGRMQRSNLLVASADILAGDMVGAKLLGYDVADVPHLVHAAKNQGRPTDLSDIEIVGEDIEAAAAFHEYNFPYTVNEKCCLPVPLAKQGLEGIHYRKFDSTLCTYCSGVTGLVLTAIRYAWKGEPWEDIELLNGKIMKPTKGMKKTILLGKCMYQLHKNNPDIKEMIAIKGCPPKPDDIVKALHQAGIEADPGLFENIDQLPGFFMRRYENNPEFDEGFFRIT